MTRAAAIVTAAALAAGPARAQAPSRQAPVVTSLTLFAGTAQGLYRSRDWGASFERVAGQRAGGSLESVGAVACILPVGPQVVLGSASGVYYSTDFGETWKRVAESGPCTALIGSRYPLADRTLFLGTPQGLQRAPLDLYAPEDMPRAFLPTPVPGRVARIEWPGPQLLVATSSGLYLSEDSGSTAGRVGTDPTAPLPAGDVTALVVSAFFAVDPALVVGVGSEGVFRSADGGRRFAHAGLRGRRVHDLVWLGPFLYASTDAGLFRTEDLGRSWTLLAEGMRDREARRLLFPLAPASGAEAFLGTDRGIYWTGDGGLNWRALGGALAEQEILALATFPQPDPVRRRGGR
ncbi:MAG TPA: hypothetical protein VFM88_05990 [Vicinamibacteria bacterium]|nr:hypothetical protein [Vicinamibacteria bacterium]